MKGQAMVVDAFYQFTQGLYILGAKDESGRFAGRTVDAVMQVASRPKIIALSCTNLGYTKGCIEKTGDFSLSFLGVNVDPFVIANFGFQSSKDINKWDKVEHYVKDGLPYLSDNIATMSAKIQQEVVFDSHTLFIAEAVDYQDTKSEEALTYNFYRQSYKEQVIKAWQSRKGE